MNVTPAQQKWLEVLANKIRELLDIVRAGNSGASYVIGTRRIDDRTVRLVISVEVLEDNVSPMSTHGQVQAESSSPATDAPPVKPRKPRKRTRRR